MRGPKPWFGSFAWGVGFPLLANAIRSTLIAIVLVAATDGSAHAESEPHTLPDSGEVERWHFGPRVGLTVALANGFGHYFAFERYTVGFDGSVGANVGYRLARRSRWYGEWMVLLSRMHVHGRTRIVGEELSERIPYLQLMPFLLRYEFDFLHLTLGPWVGAPLSGNWRVRGSNLFPILIAAALEVGFGVDVRPGRVTLNLMFQPIFHPFADHDGGSGWLHPAIFFVGYEW